MRRMLWTCCLALPFCFAPAVSAQPKVEEKPVVPAAGDDVLPKGAFRRLGTTKFRHGSRIQALAYAPNGRTLAAGGGDDPVRLWDIDSGKPLQELKEGWVQALAFSKKGSVIFTGGAFKTIKQWEVATGKEIDKNRMEGHQTAVRALALSNDGHTLASASQDGVVILWELQFAKIVSQFKTHTDEVTCLAFSPDDKYLASGSGDRTVRLWDVEEGKFIRAIDAGCAVSGVAFTADGKLASAGDDQQIRLWEVATGKPLQTFKGHPGPIVSLNAIDGKTLVSGGYDGSIRLWNLGGQGEPRVLERGLGDSDALAISKNGKFLATAGLNNTIRVIDIDTGKNVETGHLSPITGVAQLAGGHVASVSATGVVIVWDPRTKQTVKQWNVSVASEAELAASPDGKDVLIASGTEPIRCFDPATGQERYQLPANKGDATLSLSFSGDGKKLIVGRRSGNVELWDLGDKKIVQQVKYDGPAYTAVLNPKGDLLAVSGGNKIAFYEIPGGKELRKVDTKEGPPASQPMVAALAFSPDGKTLAAGCYDGIIRLFDAASGKEVRVCEGHGNVPYAIAFSGDGRTLASASFDRTVRLWETMSGLTIAEFKGHRGSVGALAFSGDGRSIISGSADTTLLVWDATRVSPEGLLPNLQANDQAADWQEMASDDPARGFNPLWRFVSVGKNSVPFLGAQVYLLDPKKVDQLFADLNSEKYTVREKATTELEKYGRWMEGRLRDLAKNPPTLEVQRRVDRMLQKLTTVGSLSLSQERLRLRRTMLILEQIGTDDALQWLEKLAQGAPEVEMQQDAQASATRLRALKK